MISVDCDKDMIITRIQNVCNKLEPELTMGHGSQSELGIVDP